MKELILEKSKKIENLTNSLSTMDPFFDNPLAVSILNEIKANNYSILNSLDEENHEVMNDSQFDSISDSVSFILSNLIYENGVASLADEATYTWDLTCEPPTEILKMVGWHAIEETGVVWGSQEQSTLVLSGNYSNNRFVGFILRTVGDTQREFEENFQLKVNFCGRKCFTKQLEDNLFIVVFPVESEKREMEVDFYYSNLGSPFEKGIGEDRRSLSLCLIATCGFAFREEV